VAPRDSVLDDAGKPVALGATIGRGGEGLVQEVVSDPSLVAKLYLRPLDNAKTEKLRIMVQSATPEILRFAAWPTSLLRSNNRTVGLLMRKMDPSNRPIHELYTPKTRLRAYPTANWLFLIHVAANVARGFGEIHRAGHVVGDVNHGNVLVGRNGTTGFIDCDSFQVSRSGQIYRCNVGVPEYTPPELQKRAFSSVDRTANHDRFGLAVLIFHLLFMGRHPFAGRYLGSGEMPIDRAIAESRFVFGRLGRNFQMDPPPNSLLLSQIPLALADGFERAFSAEAARNSPRPAAVEWVTLLEDLRNDLTQCKTHSSHLYFRRLTACPWCQIESRGIILFIEAGTAIGPDPSITGVLKRVANLASLADLPSLSAYAPEPVPTALHRARGRTRRIRVGLGIAAIAAAATVSVSANFGGGGSFALILLAVVFAFLFPRKLQQQRSAEAKHTQELQKRVVDIENKYRTDCVSRPFDVRLSQLTQLRSEYEALPLQRQRKLQELEQNKYQLQLHQFLDQISIESSKIEGIGPGRKQMLASFNVESAADLTISNLDKVPTIGPKSARRLISWRIDQEKRFRFNPQKATDKIEIDKIEREIKVRRNQLETSIKEVARDAEATHALIVTRRKQYAEQAVVARRNLAQARANYKAS